jgi:hypothetical protein
VGAIAAADFTLLVQPEARSGRCSVGHFTGLESFDPAVGLDESSIVPSIHKESHMKKVLLATVLLTSGTVLAAVSAGPASAEPIKCGYSEFGDVAFYQNCSQFGAGIRVVHRNGSVTTDCVGPYSGHKIGTSYDVETAYTYKTC